MPRYAAEVIAAWASRYLPEEPADGPPPTRGVMVAETRRRQVPERVTAGRHRLLADEPVSRWRSRQRPNPYDYLAIALGACTSMTLRIYAEHKKLALGRIMVGVSHGKVAVEHCDDCGEAIEGAPARSTGSSARSASKAASTRRWPTS